MLIVDAHLDLAWNALQWSRDLRRPVAEIRVNERGLNGHGWGNGTVALPELQQGSVAVAIATLLARPTAEPDSRNGVTVAEAEAIVRGQMAWYRTLERDGQAVVLENADALRRHIAGWRAWEADPESPHPPLGLVLSMEGADPIAGPDELPAWHDAGLRIVGLSHYGTGRYAGGTGAENGLTDLGRALLSVINELGMILDVTHLTDAGITEALDLYGGPVLASHSNVRVLVPHGRQLSDAHILAVAERGGVIGIALDGWMLSGWGSPPGSGDSVWGSHGSNPVLLQRVIDHMDYVCQLTGSSAHVGIGSDLDGGFGREQTPRDLDTVADLQLLAERLRGRGYDEDDVTAVMHGNWLRLLDECLA
jgi:membrane dipeptidase